MKGKVEKKGLIAVNRSLTGILAAAIVMSQLSGTGLVVRAAEAEISVEEVSTEIESGTEEASIEIETGTEEASTEIETGTEEASTEIETGTEEVSTEIETENETLEEIQEVGNKQEMMTEEVLTGEDALLASVYLQFEANGGACEVDLIELTPENMNLTMPIPQKAGYRFVGWYMDEACTIAYDTRNIFWEAGNTYSLYAGYEPLVLEEIELTERILQQSIHGMMITVEGNMPQDATLEVRAEALSQKEQMGIAEESEFIDSYEELALEENTCYSYDISICYQDVEYEPYLFDEKVEVTFSFADAQELQNADMMEVFHIDDNENVEKIEITDVTENEVSFEADAFSTYILITKVEYTGNKNWTYTFTGDVQTFSAPVSGEYVFECYGAGTDNSKGSFAKGTIALDKNEIVQIYVGGQNNTFNGGGAGGAVWHSASNSGGSFSDNVYSDHGCGATDVRMAAEMDTRLIVAGGGGGNGHEGGVSYSYNGFDVSHGPGYSNVYAQNQIQSNETLGKGSDYETYVNSGVWGSGSYPNKGTYSRRVVKGGGGGGYYGGKAGYAGTSKVISEISSGGKVYKATDSVVENLVHTGNGKCLVSLYSIQADVITYYDYNMTILGESAGLAGTTVSFPALLASPNRASDAKYDYTFLGWDDMATDTIEHYTDAQTVEGVLNGDRNYIAAYDCVGKSYTVTLDSANAENSGTVGIMATYHAVLPDIEIPVKAGSVFEGYFTGQNGTGTKVYSADGKGVGVSEIEEDTILYAHWVQPIVKIINPENKEVLAGYAGIILSTEVELCKPTQYSLTYQWYMSMDEQVGNDEAIELADSRKLIVPQGLQPGEYYFYCGIVATNVLNGQAVSEYTLPAKVNVEKGIMGMEQIEIETAYSIYDATPKALKAAINTSNPYTIYYGEEPLTAENYQIKGKTDPYCYIDAGEYTNYIYVTGTDFADFSGSISMIIDKAEPKVYLASKNTSYNGQVQQIDAAKVYDVNDQEIEMLVAYVYFMDEACTKKTDTSCGAMSEGGAPSAVGTYYVHAVTQETTNYHDVATKTPAMFNVLGTHIKYSISGYHGKYDGKPHGLQIVNEDTQNATIYFSDSIELTKDNYHVAGTIVPYEYTEIGEYPIYYLVVTKIAGGIEQYESGMAEVIIEEAKQNVGGNNNAGGNNNTGGNNNGSHNGGSGDNGSSGNNSGNTHKHNYELISFDQPTATKEGKAVYRCMECGHELVVTYPANGNTQGDEKNEITEKPAQKDETEIMDKPLQNEEENNKSDKEAWKEDKNDKEKESSREDSKKKELSNLTDKEMNEDSEEMADELRKAMTEAELLRMAETLKNLTEAEIREMYRKGFLNLSEEELERLIAMIRTQIIIDEEKVSLSDELPSLEQDRTANNQMSKYWSVLWAFLLGAIIMFLIREFMQKCKKKETNKQKTVRVATGTRKLK